MSIQGLISGAAFVWNVYNTVWLGLNFSPRDTDARRRSIPLLPPEYLKNLKDIAKNNPDHTVLLWVDSRRHTFKQLESLSASLSSIPDGNVQLRDLRTIPEYDQEELFNQEETSPSWRENPQSLIWRQVDTARLLVCLQGDYGSIAYSDLDIKGFRPSHHHKARGNPAIVVCGAARPFGGDPSIENSAWIFAHQHKHHIRALLEDTLEEARDGQNGWIPFLRHVERWSMEGLLSHVMPAVYDIGVPSYDHSNSAQSGRQKK